MPSAENYALVEGEWNNFTLRRISTEDYPAVLNHIKTYFLREEPTCQLLGYTEAFGDEMCRIIMELLNESMSFLAEDTATKELAAIRITFKQTKAALINDNNVVEPQSDIFMNRIDWSNAKKLEELEKAGVEEYAELIISSTHPNYRNKGLAAELYARSLNFIKAEGFKMIKCISTNEVSRRAASKLGFKEVSRVNYETLLDKTGQFAFPDSAVAAGHFAAAMIKILE